jgi:hypothetical protein
MGKRWLLGKALGWAKFALESTASFAKYCIRGSYLIAIVLSKSHCVENMVSLLGIEVKGIRGLGWRAREVQSREVRVRSAKESEHPATLLRFGPLP